MNPDDRLGAQSFADLKAHEFFKDLDFASLEKTTPPPIQAYPERMVWQEDVIREEKERQEREHDELQEKWYVRNTLE